MFSDLGLTSYIEMMRTYLASDRKGIMGNGKTYFMVGISK